MATDNLEKNSDSFIRDAKPENYFVLVTGVPLKNLKELANKLEHMNDWVFRHHVNHERNDFSNWIRYVLKEDELAEEIEDIYDKQIMEVMIFKYIVNNYM